MAGSPDAWVPPFDQPDPQPAAACNKMDIIFVVDDSGSMGEEQANLASNFPMFAQVLESFRNQAGQELDFRVAVTTTGRDLNYTIASPFPPLPATPMSERGPNGKFRNEQSCGMRRPWIERGDGNVASTFSCAAEVGTSGSSIEMPLLAMEWSLSQRVQDGSNAGFLRDDALLAVVILTDENDCSRSDNNFTIGFSENICNESSLTDVPHYLSFLDGLKEERGRWALAVIAGETDCTSEYGDASEAIRLKEMVTQTGQNAVFSSICNGDLASSLGDALNTFQSACNSFPPID